MASMIKLLNIVHFTYIFLKVILNGRYLCMQLYQNQIKPPAAPLKSIGSAYLQIPTENDKRHISLNCIISKSFHEHILCADLIEFFSIVNIQ